MLKYIYLNIECVINWKINWSCIDFNIHSPNLKICENQPENNETEHQQNINTKKMKSTSTETEDFNTSARPVRLSVVNSRYTYVDKPRNTICLNATIYESFGILSSKCYITIV